ncbi:hypothetical protein HMPREF2580_11675 [Staphylococcus sp. HMSC036D05]|uniref:LPXTG cell wall anchor domain-containing protein n=1 Tax=Staphylococcus sp. HMSC036D05 TaxID=1715059 RepID=UPI0008AA421B|nr:LPXTG cell wall anchor domain-containing protein [Staphylococcus sp. HMSC036D05]OHO67432.1 hypothetical protein HMPREF2580_11675 [Staphylococcus sp. HMSC036D05]
MTHKFIKFFISTMAIMMASIFFMYNHSVLASTSNHDLVVGHFNQTPMNDEVTHRAVNASTFNHNGEHNLNSSKSRTTHVTQPASMMTLPDTGKSVSHSPFMAGIIALILGLIIFIYKKTSTNKQ